MEPRGYSEEISLLLADEPRSPRTDRHDQRLPLRVLAAAGLASAVAAVVWCFLNGGSPAFMPAPDEGADSQGSKFASMAEVPGTTCRAVGCFGHYVPAQPCQCNDKCGQYMNCCPDFIRACQMELPPQGEETAPAVSLRKRKPDSVLTPEPERTTTERRTTVETTVVITIDITTAAPSSTTTRTSVTSTATTVTSTTATTTTRTGTTTTLTSVTRTTTTATNTTTTTRPINPLKPIIKGEVPRCEKPELCLKLVDMFLDRQPRRAGLLQALGNQQLGGGSCGESCKLPSPCKGGKCGYNTYDNALAAIYYTKRGNLAMARNILDAFKQALYPKDLKKVEPKVPEALYVGEVSKKALTLLASSYAADHDPVAGDYRMPFVADGTVDTGNNAWVALAFAHYAAAAHAPCYAAVAREILTALGRSEKCKDDLEGFLSTLPPGRGTSRSTERNVVVYAVARALSSKDEAERAGRFVRGMQRQDMYAAGTGGGARCDSETDSGPMPAAASFWTLLADADPDEGRMRAALDAALQPPGREGEGLWVHDKDVVWMSGKGATPELEGFRYTTGGDGVQWEVTASAVMALLHFMGRYESKDLQLAKFVDSVQASLSMLLGMYKGVPASVLGGKRHVDKGQSQTRSRFPGGSDTGLGYADLRYLTVAATAWTGLFYLYQGSGNGTVHEQANPFAKPAGGVPDFGGDKTCWTHV